MATADNCNGKLHYDNSPIRRQDRLLSEERATALLREGEYGVLSMVADNGEAYGVPVNFIYDGADTIYIHCAREGRKLRAIERHPQVSLCIVGRTRVVPQKFTTEYESVVVSGHAHTHLSEEEKLKAIDLLLDKLAPDHKQAGQKATLHSMPRLEVVKITIDTASGKSKKVAL